MADWMNYHIGRSWNGHRLEDACPCPQEPCGLVARANVVPDCPQHGLRACKTIRQSHTPANCPGEEADTDG